MGRHRHRFWCGSPLRRVSRSTRRSIANGPSRSAASSTRTGRCGPLLFVRTAAAWCWYWRIRAATRWISCSPIAPRGSPMTSRPFCSWRRASPPHSASFTVGGWSTGTSSLRTSSPFSATGRAWLTGFGLVCRQPAEGRPASAPVVLAGTLPYISPRADGALGPGRRREKRSLFSRRHVI